MSKPGAFSVDRYGSFPPSSAVFSDMWQALMTDVSAACREVIEVSQARGMDKHVYMSLPRPGVSDASVISFEVLVTLG